MTEGYIKLYRSFTEWEWYDDEACVRLFVHLLMIVNWRESRWHGRHLPAGSKVISQVEIAANLGWSRQKMGRTLDKLKNTGEVITEPGTKWTLVTLVNWDKYQCQEGRTGHQPGINRASTGHQPGTEEEGKKLRREERTAIAVPRATTPEEFKAQCAEVAAEHPDLLPPSLRKGFFDYWTERDARGRMRLQAEKHFEIPRRMTTWRTNAEKRGEIVAPSPERKTGWLTPDGK